MDLEDEPPPQDSDSKDVEALLESGSFFVPWSELTISAKNALGPDARRLVREMSFEPDEIAVVLVQPHPRDHSHTLHGIYTMTRDGFAELHAIHLERLKSQSS